MAIDTKHYRVYWLAEQGLAPKRAFLVIIPLFIFVVTNVLMRYKGEKQMKHAKKRNAIDVLTVSASTINTLCGNIAGGALLTNALYSKLIFVGMMGWAI